MNGQRRYKAVFFDAGDTLITIPAAHELFEKYLAEKQFPLRPGFVQQLLDEAMGRFYYNKEDDPPRSVSAESDRAYWVFIYRYVLDKLGARKHWSENAILRICEELYDLFVAPEHYVLFDDVKECLERLAAAGYRLGLVSNFAPTLAAICRHLGIADYFDPFIVSTEVGLEKPDPRIFELALERANLEPAGVVYIGDHPKNDIWASAQVGMDSIRIVRYGGAANAGEIRSLRELDGRIAM